MHKEWANRNMWGQGEGGGQHACVWGEEWWMQERGESAEGVAWD